MSMYDSRENQPTSHDDSLVGVEGRWRQGEPPTSHGNSLVVVEGRCRGGGQMEARPTNESLMHYDSLVVDVAGVASGGVGVAGIAGVREPPTRRNAWGGVDVAGIAGGGGERASN